MPKSQNVSVQLDFAHKVPPNGASKVFPGFNSKWKRGMDLLLCTRFSSALSSSISAHELIALTLYDDSNPVSFLTFYLSDTQACKCFYSTLLTSVRLGYPNS